MYLYKLTQKSYPASFFIKIEQETRWLILQLLSTKGAVLSKLVSNQITLE